MKHLKKWILSLCTCIIMILSLTGCNRYHPKEVCGKYELSYVSGLPGVSVSTYDYNTIELKSSGKYILENKVYGVITSQKGTWSINKELTIIEMTTKQNSTKVTEEIDYDAETHTIEISQSLQGYQVILRFEKAN